MSKFKLTHYPSACPYFAASAFRHDFPAHGRIHMPAAVVSYGCADILGDAIQVAQQFLDRKSLKIGLAFEGFIEVRNVRAVVLVVVDLHRHLVDVRLERIRWIWKRRKNVGHLTLLR